MTLLLISAGAALAISFLCSLLEATLLSYSPSQVAALEARRPRVWRIWRDFKDNIERPIAVILVTNTISHTVGATVAGAQAEKVFGGQGLLIFSLVFTFLMLQFTEILPKSLGVHFNALLAPAIAPPLQALTRVMGPILWFIHLINLPFAGRKQSEDTTLEQISGLAAAARLSRVIDPHQARMIEAASELEDIKVRQIMTPRTEVQYLRVNQPIEETLGIIQSCPYTRLPLCEGSIDNIIGIVNVKDVMRGLDLAPGRFRIEQGEGNSGEREARSGPGSGKHVFGSGTIDLRRIQRDALALPENINILQALRRFQAERQHMAVVVDEYGATQGIVTLEDVLEEMVGDIEDEFDPSAPQRIRPEGDGYRVEGRVSLYELASRIPGLGIDHTEEQVDTAGGYVSQLMGRVPARGDRVISRGFSWTVTLADARQVHEVFLEPLPEPEEGEER